MCLIIAYRSFVFPEIPKSLEVLALFDTDSWKNSAFHIFLIGEKDADRRRDVDN